MIIYPAIDIKDGNCVRLKQGKMEEETIFPLKPYQQAKLWQDAGFKWLHVVDLNGAIEGEPHNIETVKKLIENVKIPVQLGGGIRDVATAINWLETGISRIILGTAAIETPAIISELCQKFPGQIAAGIDAKKGFVATRGWVKDTGTKAVDLAKKLEDTGVAAIIYTDIERDGLLKGPNLEETLKLAASVEIPVILSGGISSIADVKAIRASGKIAGVVIGRALYSGAIDAMEVLRV